MADNNNDWDWDIGQWLTPPKSKSPWTAMTEGSTDKWAKGAEQWGPMINSYLNAIFPVVGGMVGGAIGLEGRGTGFQGTDKGWGNILPIANGLVKGSQSNPINGLIQGVSGYTKQDLGQAEQDTGQDWIQSLMKLVMGSKNTGSNFSGTQMPRTTQPTLAMSFAR